MRFSSLSEFLVKGRSSLEKGPIALIFAEDATEVESTLRHHHRQGFRTLVLFADPALGLPHLDLPGLQVVARDLFAADAVTGAVNAVIEAAPGQWLFYGYNAEYLFYPFCETRSIGEFTAFVTEERRASVLTFVVDLYAADLGAHPNAVSLQDAHLDKSGYYALARRDAANHGHPMDRQLDFFGGLRWRFEEHVPPNRRRIDRVSLFRAGPGLRLRADHTLSEPEMNTYACPWHHSVTAALCSFRTAKALKRNPGSTWDIKGFTWRNSARFGWTSQELLDLGLMEPGQWF